LVASVRFYRGEFVPFEVKDFILAPDFVEFLAAFVTMAIAFTIMVVLGKWWAQ
jgi:hypothetical protein